MKKRVDDLALILFVCFVAGKMACLEELLEASISCVGDRVVVVCSSVKALDLIESMCSLKQWKTVRIDGSTSADQRQDIVTSFNLYNTAKVLVFLRFMNCPANCTASCRTKTIS